MQAVKRVEIVVASPVVKEALQILEKKGVSGYTIIRDVIGKGERGEASGDELTDVFRNSYILTVCSEEQARLVTEAIRPLLKKFGGVCLVSDAHWVKH